MTFFPAPVASHYSLPSEGGVLVPPQVLLSDEHMYLKNDVTKKWLFCLIKGVFEMGLLR